LLIQWGTIAGGADIKTIYMPTTLKTAYYTIQFTGEAVNQTEKIVYSPMFYSRSGSSFSVLTRYIAQGGNVNETAWNFTWLAIGNWK
jgi:hypothetical protein